MRGEIFTADGADHGFFNNPPWYERTLYRADEFLASVGYIKGLPTISRPSHTPGSSQDRPPPPNKRLVRPAKARPLGRRSLARLFDFCFSGRIVGYPDKSFQKESGR